MSTVEPAEFGNLLREDRHADSALEAFIVESVKEIAERFQDNPHAVKSMETWIRSSYGDGLKHVKACSESPLERVFMLALMMGVLKWDPLSFVWTKPCDFDIAEALDVYREHHGLALQAIGVYKESTGNESVWPMIERIELEMKNEDSDEREAARVMFFHVMEHALGLSRAFHITMQPKFKKILVDGRTFRADALVWIPSDPDYKVILECDGYDYHADKPRFTTDRRRDRVLAMNGYKVMRFSGAEVFENPIATAVEAFDFLSSQRKDAGVPIQT